MTAHITLPRALVEQVREALEAMQSYAAAERKGLRICDEAIIALDAALAEPEPTGKNSLQVDAERYRWLRGEVQGPHTPLAQVVWKRNNIRKSGDWTNLSDGQTLDEAIDAALAEPQPEPDALRRWANTDDGPPKTKWQGGYDAARRWVREVGLPSLVEPEQKPEPVAWMHEFLNPFDEEDTAFRTAAEMHRAEKMQHVDRAVWTPLYAAPPAAAKPEPATDEQIVKAGGECAVVDDEYLLDFRDGWRDAERFHGIRGSK
jgi:hypothetical protein